MKFNRWFIISIVLFVSIMFIIEYNLPKKFVWTPTFGHYDHQPFGCAVFDDVADNTISEGYSISDKTFYQLSQQADDPRTILSVTQTLSLSETDVEAVFKLAERGNRIILVSNSFSKELEDTLRFSTAHDYFRFSELKRYATSLQTRDSLVWLKDSVYRERTFRCYPQLLGVEIETEDSCLLVPLVNNYRVNEMQGDSMRMTHAHEPVAMSYPVGEGEIIVAVTPLLFTNYGMLDADNAVYLFRYLTGKRALPVVRTEAYTKAVIEEQSPLRYFLSQRPLRWALYLLVVVLLLSMVFAARRRQRVIPVMRKPENKNLEFTELIGTLYYQKKNHADLVRKKFTYFAESLRRNLQIDVEDANNDELLASRIARKTGEDEAKTLHLLRSLRPVLRDEVKISERQMQELIDGMVCLGKKEGYEFD